MIAEATVKTLARIQGVDPAVIDRDHALGVVLWALNQQLTAQGWVFKGGTCLRKCYFGDYRFSEDLDFTVIGRLDTEGALATIAACEPAATSQGVRLVLEDARAGVMDDEYGRESIEIRVPYRGALRMGSAPNVQFHLSADEELAFEPLLRPLLHPYDDAVGLACEIRSYALEEVLTEKLRAAAGQREYAVALVPGGRRPRFRVGVHRDYGPVEEDLGAARHSLVRFVAQTLLRRLLSKGNLSATRACAWCRSGTSSRVRQQETVAGWTASDLCYTQCCHTVRIT